MEESIAAVLRVNLKDVEEKFGTPFQSLVQ
jgi:hypothetical protein